MSLSMSTCIADTFAFSWLLGSRAVGIALWTGLAVLSVTLLVLMWTRWGQVKPLSKCVALSVFAHVLLCLYAYGTHLFVQGPPFGHDDVITLALVAPESTSEDVTRQTESKPWEQFAAKDVVDPETVQPDSVKMQRTVAESDRPVRRDADVDWVPSEEVIPQDNVPMPSPNRPTMQQPQAAMPRAVRSKVMPAKIEMPMPRKHARPKTMVPMPAAPKRLQTRPVPPLPLQQARQTPEPHLPTGLVDVGSRMQQMADIVPNSETADARAAQTDRLEQSDNRGASNVDSSGIARDVQSVQQTHPDGLVAMSMMTRAGSTVVNAGPNLVDQVVAGMPRRLGDGQPLPEPYRLRSDPRRRAVAAQLGGSVEAEAAVDAALVWLAANQEEDGRWDAGRWGAGGEKKIAGHDRGGAGTDGDTGVTGLALLAFLANGQSHLEGKYRKNVQRGLEFLLRSQAENGSMAGHARLFASMYCHGIASLALSEAFALTGDVRIKPYVERAVAFTIAAQHPMSGGWRYQPGDQGDMSQFGWQVMVLRSADLAGIPVPQETRSGMIRFLNQCTGGRYGGLASYQPGRPVSRAMTAEALASRYFLHLPVDPAVVDEATEFVLGELPQNGVSNLYYWYYATVALFQVQGEPWRKWNVAMQRQLIRQQQIRGPNVGSWDPDSVWGSYGGRVYSTAMATLCLEVYYRYLPLTSLHAGR